MLNRDIIDCFDSFSAFIVDELFTRAFQNYVVNERSEPKIILSNSLLILKKTFLRKTAKSLVETSFDMWWHVNAPGNGTERNQNNSVRRFLHDSLKFLQNIGIFRPSNVCLLKHFTSL